MGKGGEGNREQEGKGRGQEGGKGLRKERRDGKGKGKTDRAWFSRFLRHLVRKRSRSILSTRALIHMGLMITLVMTRAVARS